MENLAMPNNISAEQELLGGILNTPNLLVDIIGVVKPEDFYQTRHKIIFRAIEELFSNNIKIDPVTLADKLKNMLTEIGGITYISQLAGSSIGRNVKEYAKIIKEKSNKRKLIRAAKELMESCYKDEEAATELVSKTEEELFKVSLNKENKMEAFNTVLESTISNIENICNNGTNGVTGIDTGFKDLNCMTGGLQKQNLIILAARPSMGKTTLAVNIGTNISKDKVVAVFSLEMSKEELARKVLSSSTHIDLIKINTGVLKDTDWECIAKASGPLASRKLFIDDTAGITVNEIKAKCKKIKIQYGLSVVIIDYLQLIKGTSRGDNRVQEISQISRELKQLAKELDVSVIALSQLSRAPEVRTNHRPILSDLRESGSIEQDADIVMFLYRDEYYNKESEEKNIAECIFAKNRSGKVGTVKLAWLGAYQKFGTLF